MIISELLKMATFMNDIAMASADTRTRALLACWPRLSAIAETATARDPCWHEKWRHVGTPDVRSANRSPLN